MFLRKTKGVPAIDKSFGTVIAEGIVIESGVIKGSGNVRIDGFFSGNISLDGHIIVGSTGTVSGDITAKSASFAGTFSGNMSISNTVHFAMESNVIGQVEADKIIVDEGAVFNGHITSAKVLQEEMTL